MPLQWSMSQYESLFNDSVDNESLSTGNKEVQMLNIYFIEASTHSNESVIR